MKKICITGANGFIGKSLCERLNKPGNVIRGIVRTLSPDLKLNNVEYLTLNDISGKINLDKSLKNFDCIIHCAGKVNSTEKENKSDTYFSANTELTKDLVEQAAKLKIKRFIFLSTIKINGECTGIEMNNEIKKKFSKVFKYSDVPNPQDLYSCSKFEAEKALQEISSRTGLEVIVVRLPLVYGYSVKGNLAKLIKLVRSGIPLPLSLVKNQRSMIGMDNLVDLLIRCIDHPEASGKTFLASDGMDLSTPELIKLIASSMGRKANLFPFPIFMLKFLGLVFGRSEEINRLVGSLRVDNSYTKKILNWVPPISVEEGIRRMVQGK